MAGTRTGEHDGAAVAGDHAGEDQACELERGENVHVDHAALGRPVAAIEQRLIAETGVVDQHVDVIAVQQSCGQGVDRDRVGEITRQHSDDELWMEADEFGCEIVEPLGAAGDEDQFGGSGRELAGHRVADP
ncbi:hypothetical protein AADG42_08730 [Ammonicoccus fulvus]|uniref:Uncharacterized protein n=1 Tax=Ammonicoccus fulvus TaxID=3138240 RepID=A0ABZ3FRK0_9ACTN